MKERWNEEVINLTYDVLRDVQLGSFMRGKGCHLENIDGRRGCISIDDAMAYRYAVRDEETDEVLFSTTDLMGLIDEVWKEST